MLGRSKGYVQYALGAAAGVLMLGACDDPTQNTGLRPEGPPDVLAVLVLTDAAAQLYETATYCRPGDEKRPTQVGLPDFTLSQICDADPSVPAPMVTGAYPDGWYVRIMFDELLDPEIEELVEILDPDTGEGTDTFSGTIANTQPVILECESVAGGFVEVPYDGYYSPAGNAVTWPLGPALVIKPDEPRAIATNKTCRIRLRDNITDKSGNQVPEDQRGPYEFKIAPITPIDMTPADGDEIDAFVLSPNGDNVYVHFNTSIDPTSWCDDGVGMDECEFTFTPVDTGVCDNAAGTGSGTYCVIGTACSTAGETCMPAGAEAFTSTALGLTDSEYLFYPLAPVQTEKEYTFAFKQGGKIKDRCGVETTFGAPSVDDLTQATYTTLPFDLNTILPGNGDTVSALRKPELAFNNVIDVSSLIPGEYTITPAPSTASVASPSENNALFAGHYAPGTMYTFNLIANATVEDAFGKVWTNPAAESITWTTSALAITSISPANNGTSTKATPASSTRISISFNQSMLPGSLDPATEMVLTSTTNTTPIPLGAVTISGCAVTSTTCSLRADTVSPLSPGTYKFTLKAGATVSDVLTPANVYTQAADRSVTFKVVEAAAPVVCL
ncbi:MAG: hypothetical protein H0T42_26350 [Deltaproteobacteria bacterium]|nr:hypothetical protein [Deltaproteobacteria bacterium]